MSLLCILVGFVRTEPDIVIVNFISISALLTITLAWTLVPDPPGVIHQTVGGPGLGALSSEKERERREG